MSFDVRIGGMSVDDFVRAAISGQVRGATVVSGNVFSMTPSHIAEENIPTRKFGRKKIDRVEVGAKNLVFDGTTVKLAKTRACIELKNGAKVEKADASSEIKAENCPSLGHLHAAGAIILTKSSVLQANAGGKIVAEDCEKVGHLHAGGKVKLTNCSFGSAHAGGKVKADNCKNFEALSAGGKIAIKNSEVNSISAGGKANVRKSTIHKVLKFSQDSTIADSTVKSIVVLPNCGRGVTIIDGRVMGSSMSQRSTNVYLKNTVVEKNIRFKTIGKVFLRGSSEVKGKVINGSVVRTSEARPPKHAVVVRKTETSIETSVIPAVAEPSLPLNERKGIFHFFTRKMRIIFGKCFGMDQDLNNKAKN